jgi:hypothetical protein
MSYRKRLLIGTALVAAIASQALPAEPRLPKLAPLAPPASGAGAWVNSGRLEIIGATFPTLPEPYVSVNIVNVAAIDGAPQAESRVVSNQRVSITLAEAALLRDALDAFIANPSSTQTLLVKRY